MATICTEAAAGECREIVAGSRTYQGQPATTFTVALDKTSTAVGQRPKAHTHSTFASGNRLRIKVEMNTFERSPALATTSRILTIDSPCFEGSAEIPTFEAEELTATKIRAIYQRSKGRDLFDLWLEVHLAGVEPADVAACFGPYRPDGWTPALALANPETKLADQTFTTDIDALLVDRPDGYDAEKAAATVRSILSAIEELT